MRHKTKIAAVGALMFAGLASGMTTASATPESNIGVFQTDCQIFGVKRTPPASSISTCNSLGPGYSKFRAVVECADGLRHYGNSVLPHQISTARCPANVHMTSNGPWTQLLI